MGRKFTLAVGLGAGFILGSKAGRKPYEAFRRVIHRIRHTRPVAKGVEAVADKASDAVRIQGIEFSERAADRVHSRIMGTGALAPEDVRIESVRVEEVTDDVEWR